MIMIMIQCFDEIKQINICYKYIIIYLLITKKFEVYLFQLISNLLYIQNVSENLKSKNNYIYLYIFNYKYFLIFIVFNKI